MEVPLYYGLFILPLEHLILLATEIFASEHLVLPATPHTTCRQQSKLRTPHFDWSNTPLEQLFLRTPPLDAFVCCGKLTLFQFRCFLQAAVLVFYCALSQR